MINLPLIAYFLFLFFIIAGAFAIVYHLRVNKLNERISTITSLIFIVGFLLLMTFNVASAIQIDWELLSFDFRGVSTNLDNLELDYSLYE